MPTFNTKFTADITQYQRNLQAMKRSTGEVASSLKKMVAVGAAFGGLYGLTRATGAIIALGGEMQNTRTSFEVLMGSVEKGNRALAVLNNFSDATPFDNKEVIASGRALMNVGVGTDQLTDKLTMLGNIASGVQAPLIDMVNIYAKAANKGKVGAQELMQLSERGVPAIQALAMTLSVSTEEVVELSSKGKLSFALLEDALQSLGGAGGQYFGLMEKQSQNFLSKVDGIKIGIRNAATEIGERSLPALTAVADELIAKFDEMSKNGELDAMIRSLADTISGTVKAIRNLAATIAEHKETIFSLGKAAFYYVAWMKFNLALTFVRQSFQALAAGQTLAAMRRMSPVLRIITTDINTLIKVTGKLQTSLMGIGSVAASAFIGWEVGKAIADLIKLEDHLTRMLLKMRGMTDAEIDLEMNPKVKPTPSIEKRDLVADRDRQRALKKEIAELERDAAALATSADPVANRSAIPLNTRAKALKKELAELENASGEYKRKAAQEAAGVESAKKAWIEAGKRVKNAKADAAKSPGERARMTAMTPGFVALEPSPPQTGVEKQINDAAKEAADLERIYQSKEQTSKEFNDAMRALRAAEAADAVDSARKVSAAEQFKSDRASEFAQSRLKLEKEVAEARKSLQKEQRDLGDEVFRDTVSERIEKWRDNIKGYQKEIDATEKKLSKLGLSVDEDILLTPEKILQKKNDEILQKKIEAANRGEKVKFTKEERNRIGQLSEEQRKAREAREKTKSDEALIESDEKSLANLDRQRRGEDRADRKRALDVKARSISAAEAQLKVAREAAQPTEKLLTQIAEILKNGLPEGG